MLGANLRTMCARADWTSSGNLHAQTSMHMRRTQIATCSNRTSKHARCTRWPVRSNRTWDVRALACNHAHSRHKLSYKRIRVRGAMHFRSAHQGARLEAYAHWACTTSCALHVDIPAHSARASRCTFAEYIHAHATRTSSCKRATLRLHIPSRTQALMPPPSLSQAD